MQTTSETSTQPVHNYWNTVVFISSRGHVQEQILKAQGCRRGDTVHVFFMGITTCIGITYDCEFPARYVNTWLIQLSCLMNMPGCGRKR